MRGHGRTLILFKISFITEFYSFAEYIFFETFYGPDTVLGPGVVAVNKMGKTPALMNSHAWT